MKNQTAIVIGSGFAGLSAATKLASEGYSVTILEKNNQPGGRARQFEEAGFTFDMGPSWYWMPDVFEEYFNRFGKSVSDYYQLERLDPSYRVYFPDGPTDIPATPEAVANLFDKIEPGSGKALKEFLKDAEYKYQVGIQELVYKPGRSLLEFADLRVLKGLLQMNLLSSMRKFIRKSFNHPKITEILEFPILFLGALPENTPALYSLMNYADISLGTWYPKGGMHKIVEAMVSLAIEKGVVIKTGEEVLGFRYQSNTISGVMTTNGEFEADVVVAAADYHHVDQHLLSPEFKMYSPKYWDSRKLAPSSLLYYLGFNTRIPELEHHNLFFDADFGVHSKQIYSDPKWPDDPLFYACVPSKTDTTVAPEGSENAFLLIPVAPDMKENPEVQEKYFNMVLDRLEKHTGRELRKHLVYRRDYGYTNFVEDYHSFKGNAYGLANTLDQTAVLKPKLKNSKLTNLYFTGQLTTPGPGVPPSLISGQVVAGEIIKDHKVKSA